jgi:hypothetical protein
MNTPTEFDSLLLAEAHRIPPEHHARLLDMVRDFREHLVLNTAEASFRQGWQEMTKGEIQPIAALWEGIHDE